MPSRIKVLLATLVILFTAAGSASAAPEPEMAFEMNPGPSGSRPSDLTVFKNSLLFFARDGVHGSEPWIFDGSKAQMLADIRPGLLGSGGYQFVVVGNLAFFVADDGIHGEELWRTDGTAAGTVMVKDIWPGSESGGPSYLTALGNTLFFQAGDSADNSELWRSDGTSAGTVQVADINPGGSANISWLSPMGGLLYFVATDGGSPTIWKSDGTALGTTKAVPVPPFTGAWNLVVAGNRLFFAANGGGMGNEPWKLEGGVATQVKDIWPGAPGSSPSNFTVVGNDVYFTAGNGSDGYEPWRSDGTPGGTVMVKDVNPGSSSSNPWAFVQQGDHVYFAADNGVVGNEPWRTDGTPAGTQLVKDINPGPFHSWPWGYTRLGDQIYFFANSEQHGEELWKTDGTTTTLVSDLFPGIDGQAETMLVPFAGTLYFEGNDGVRGGELWRLAEPKVAAPPATVSIGANPVKLDAKGRIKVHLTCAPAIASGPCSGRLKLTTARKVAIGAKKAKRKPRKRKITLANKPFSIPAGKSQTVTIKLKKRTATLLRSNKQARRVKTTATLANSQSATRTLTIKPHTPKKKPKKRR